MSARPKLLSAAPEASEDLGCQEAGDGPQNLEEQVDFVQL